MCLPIANARKLLFFLRPNMVRIVLDVIFVKLTLITVRYMEINRKENAKKLSNIFKKAM